MRNIFYIILYSLTCFILLISPLQAQTKKQDKLIKKVYKKLQTFDHNLHHWRHVGDIKIDSIALQPHNQIIQLFWSTPLSYLPIREQHTRQFTTSLRQQLGKSFKNYDVQVFADNQPLESLIPNYYRNSMDIDSSRFMPSVKPYIPLVNRIHQPIFENGLSNNHIALWHSHGWYYESKLDRWEWQRARLHSTVEDIFPITFVLPYLVPMLENSGANVFLPRERDIQVNEVIVDNNYSTGNSYMKINGLKPDTVNTGFAWQDTLKAGDNPFSMGSSLKFRTSTDASRFVNYIPDFPEEGEYAVYVSYSACDEGVKEVMYSVYHTGGKTDFTINQQMGFGTWIYLGTFHFKKGINAEQGSVEVHSQNDHSGWITTDAVRFGGGMGNIARKPSAELLPNQRSLKNLQTNQTDTTKINPNSFQLKMSEKPRYMEAARYYLQYAGMPDTLVFSLNEEKNDYNDDYQSRGEWVNYLMGNPNGPTNHRDVRGLNIPIDLSFAFHTDAGVTPNDSVIGTLGIYSSVRDDGIFPNGQSKMASRDLTDIIQTQIVEDIRATFDPDWTRRGIWNRQYSEAWRPNVPAMLLELLSHQNLGDMRWGLDPRFRFHVSRSIYKGMLKFLAFQEDREYVVQPLPVDHFSIYKADNQLLRLSWKASVDPLEPSAKPTMYKVYVREDNNGFDNGRIVRDTVIIFPVTEKDKIYSFKITALNSGGESFPSEILSAGIKSNSNHTALVVNAFDRICGPEIMDTGEMAGIAWWKDRGVPDKYEFGYTGTPYDFSRKSLWLDDDSPGWGASYGNLEGQIIPGNSFDNTYTHGEALMAAGYSFISMSDESFCHPDFDPSSFNLVDIIMGEEKSTPDYYNPGKYHYRIYTQALQNKLQEITDSRGNLFISGAYIATDFMITGDTIASNFARNVLHFTWRTDHAVTTGGFYSTDYARPDFSGDWVFNTKYHPEIYTVESPDAIEPYGNGAITAFRYRENNASAGIVYEGEYKIVALGFPYETIIDQDQRINLMKQITDFFIK